MLRPTLRLCSVVRFSAERSIVRLTNRSPGHIPSKDFPAPVPSGDAPGENSTTPKPDPEHDFIWEQRTKPTTPTSLKWPDEPEQQIKSYVAKNPLPDVLHVYRSLLRALTYIPDSWARKILRDRIRKGFKKSRLDNTTVEGIKLYRRRLKNAQKEASCILRAGKGNRKDLEKVLLEAYGRFGKRRRELVDELLKPDGSEQPLTVPLPASLTENKFYVLLKKLPALQHLSTQKIHTFIHSQQNKPSPEAAPTRTKIKAPFPNIPKENTWGRKVPYRRQISIVKKWWATILERLSPPVPQSEWDRLRDLSRGVIPIPERIPRRVSLKPKMDDTQRDAQRHAKVLEQLKNSRTGGNVAFDSQQGLYVKEEEEDEMSPQNYQRTMRRLYSGIWNQTPVMWQDEETKKWHVKWGEMKSKFHSGIVPQGSAEDPFFQELPEYQLSDAHRKELTKWMEKGLQDHRSPEREDTTEWVELTPAQIQKVKKEYKEMKRARYPFTSAFLVSEPKDIPN